MSIRGTTRQRGDNDYSNIGVSGRRTGLVLPQGRLDVNGIEEISGIFSSPRKPSPLKNVSYTRDPEDSEEQENITPKQTRSSRKVLPRSASPRKSGISGTARRSTAVDILNQNSAKQNQIISPRGNTKISAPNSRSTARQPSSSADEQEDDAPVASRKRAAPIRMFDEAHEGTRRADSHHLTSSPQVDVVNDSPDRNSSYGHALGDSIGKKANTTVFEDAPLPPLIDDDDNYGTEVYAASAAKSHIQQPKEPMTANSRRKRKSDLLDLENEPEPASSPAAKRAKRISNENAHAKPQSAPVPIRDAASPNHSVEKRSRNQSTMSARQQEELDKVVEKIRARPGEKKSLYILRREGRDTNTVLTRSGRVSVKPLAYWRNERCVYGGSPSGATLADGARFPLNSIKEIIRTEDNDSKRKKKAKKQKKPKGAQPSRSQSAEETEEVGDSSDEDSEDADAEPWETEIGTIKGSVGLWDNDQQTAVRGEEVVDIAYAAGAIETRDVKDSDFKYAKLYSSPFLGSGLVVLPPGAIKKPKNSRKMQMCFFVAEGRVSVTVGSIEGPENVFSIGKGGFWQVPRGNQYSIKNEHSKTATVFFSQACQPASWNSEQ